MQLKDKIAPGNNEPSKISTKPVPTAADHDRVLLYMPKGAMESWFKLHGSSGRTLEDWKALCKEHGASQGSDYEKLGNILRYAACALPTHNITLTLLLVLSLPQVCGRLSICMETAGHTPAASGPSWARRLAKVGRPKPGHHAKHNACDTIKREHVLHASVICSG